MGFREKLRIILDLHEIKVYNLASYLGYDASYISKWMTGSKTPPSKHIKKINRAIGEFCAQQGTPVQKKETIAFLQVDIDYTNFDAYASIVSQYLSSSDSVMENISKSGIPSFPLSGAASDYHSIFNKQLSQIRCTKLTCIMTLPVFMNLYKILLDLSSEHFEKITIYVLAAPTLLHLSTKDLCKILCCFFSYYPKKEVLFYPVNPPTSTCSVNDFLIVKNGFVIRPVSLLFTRADQWISIVDADYVHENYKSAMAYLEHYSPLWISAPERSPIAKAESYRFDMSAIHRYLCHKLSPTASSESLSSLLDEMFPSASDCDFVYKKYRQDSFHIRDMLVYESTLLDFLSTGHLQISPSVEISLPEKDRPSYLAELIAETKLEKSPLSLRIIKDQNPVLTYANCSMNLSLSDDSGFLWNCNNDSNEIFYLCTPESIEIFNSIFRLLKELPEQYLLSPEKSTEYIQRLLQFL